MAGASSGVALGAIGVGAALLWSALKNEALTTVIRDVLQGKAPPSSGPDALATATESNDPTGTAELQDEASSASSSGGDAGNQALGKLLAAPYGWSTGTNWDDLVKLWNQESGWNNLADNGSSGAYGIPQALPYTKMPKAAWPASAGGTSDAKAQITWGLSYIASRYGNPTNAWAHEVANDWY